MQERAGKEGKKEERKKKKQKSRKEKERRYDNSRESFKHVGTEQAGKNYTKNGSIQALFFLETKNEQKQ